jgi:sterol 24-C-methyltransferase
MSRTAIQGYNTPIFVANSAARNDPFMSRMATTKLLHLRYNKKTMDTLTEKLSKIKNVFRLEPLISLEASKEYIAKYYKTNRFAYSLFHTFSDRMYMGISRDGVYKASDLLEAARLVERHITELKAKNILELATGRGATSFYLAKRFPDVQFEGVDLSPGQLDFALKKARKVKNYRPVSGDFHTLAAFSEASFDILFVIEALCYSQEKEKVLREADRVLRPGGVFIIFDGYSKREISTLSDEELLAKKIVEKGMAVPSFEPYKNFMATVSRSGFHVVSDEDASRFILPTCKRFERLARKVFISKMFAKAIVKLFPSEFTYNIAAALLMPDAISRNIFCYHISVLKK